MALDLSKRVRRPAQFEEMIRGLVSGSPPAFTTMADLLVYAAAFAYHRDVDRRAFENASEPIALSVFINSQYDGFILMLAAQASGDFGIADVARTDDVILIFEEYAAAGLAMLQDVLQRERRREPVDVLRDLALEAFTTLETKSDPDFTKLLNELT